MWTREWKCDLAAFRIESEATVEQIGGNFTNSFHSLCDWDRLFITARRTRSAVIKNARVGGAAPPSPLYWAAGRKSKRAEEVWVAGSAAQRGRAILNQYLGDERARIIIKQCTPPCDVNEWWSTRKLKRRAPAPRRHLRSLSHCLLGIIEAQKQPLSCRPQPALFLFPSFRFPSFAALLMATSNRGTSQRSHTLPQSCFIFRLLLGKYTFIRCKEVSSWAEPEKLLKMLSSGYANFYFTMETFSCSNISSNFIPVDGF